MSAPSRSRSLIGEAAPRSNVRQAGPTGVATGHQFQPRPGRCRSDRCLRAAACARSQGTSLASIGMRRRGMWPGRAVPLRSRASPGWPPPPLTRGRMEGKMRQTGFVALGLIAALASAPAPARGEAPAYQGRPETPPGSYEIKPLPPAADPVPGGRPGFQGAPPSRPGPSQIHPAPSPPAARPPQGAPAPGPPPRRDDREHGRVPDYWHRPDPGWRPHPWGPSPGYEPYSPYYSPYYPYYPYYPPPSPTWVPGHWEWNGWQWVWQPGHWRYN